jgi:uroporphyrinogen III methyltransferase / synthase
MSKVYLIGAGPGNEELATVKAIRVLRQCSAVLYDRLAGGNLLKHLRENCEIYYCGKEPGCHYKTQEEINEMLVSLAKEGHIVGRIKGGDPYVFGRGGEEAQRLRQEGIPFEVVPGVTSAIAVLSYAGIPVTHRKIAQSFHVFTGKSAEKLTVDWEAVAKLKGTLIFLMGLESLPNITAKLMEKGMSPEMPAAVVMRGTTSKQKKVIGTLQNIAVEAEREKLKSPCIIVIGAVVELSDSLDWYLHKPLQCLNICVTRSKEQAASTVERLIDLGAEVTEINSIKILNTAFKLEPLLHKLEKYNYIVMNSINSVNIFFDYLKENNIDVRSLKASFAVIGPSTERVLRDRGIIADIKAEEFVGEKLAEKLQKIVKSGDSVLIPCSSESRRTSAEALIAAGCIVDEVHIYEPALGTVHNERSFEDVDVVLYTSPSTVRNMIVLLGLDALKGKTALAIGPITEKELIKNGISCYVSDEYTEEGLINKLIELKQCEGRG